MLLEFHFKNGKKVTVDFVDSLDDFMSENT